MVSDKLTLKPRLCPNFFPSHLTQSWCFLITANNKKLHPAKLFQLLNCVNMCCKIRFGDMQMSDFRFAFDPKEQRAVKKTWLVFGKAPKFSQKLRAQSMIEKSSNEQERRRYKKQMWHLLLLALWPFWHWCLFILVTKNVLHLIIDTSSRPKETSQEQESWVEHEGVKTALVTSHWKQRKEIVCHLGTCAYLLSCRGLDEKINTPLRSACSIWSLSREGISLA